MPPGSQRGTYISLSDYPCLLFPIASHPSAADLFIFTMCTQGSPGSYELQKVTGIMACYIIACNLHYSLQRPAAYFSELCLGVHWQIKP